MCGVYRGSSERGGQTEGGCRVTCRISSDVSFWCSVNKRTEREGEGGGRCAVDRSHANSASTFPIYGRSGADPKTGKLGADA